jgi:hypothetical protein
MIMGINSGFRLRASIPNPAGGEYAKPTEAEIEQMSDAVCAEARASLKRLQALMIPAYEGKTMVVAGALAGVYISALADFFDQNRAEGQEKSFRIYDEVIDCMAAKADGLKAIGMLTAMGFPPAAAAEMAAGGVKVITI